MSNVHIQEINDASGDLVDLIYYHHACAPDGVLDWPAPEAIDYPVYCGPDGPRTDATPGCGLRVDAVPLTTEGRAYAAELAPDGVEAL